MTMVSSSKLSPRLKGYAGADLPTIVDLQDVETNQEIRWTTGLEELDRVLGGGLVEGSVVLIGGDPGIGKSTLLLQTVANLSNDFNTLYVTGEESLKQVSLRSKKIGCGKSQNQIIG
jgi:DNA repair protein RadA/Sms